MEALAQALGLPCERRDIVVADRWKTAKPWVRPTLGHLDLERSAPLEPPWPDLVLTTGRRPGMAALWIAKQSGGRTRTVMVGKPSGRMGCFDLVIGSAESQLPPLPNLLPISLPLMRVDEEEVEKEAARWRERLAPLPRPLVSFLVGGATGPFSFDRKATRRLLDEIAAVAARGGTPYVTTSRRTPAAVVAALEAELPPSGHLFRWTPDAADNPYRALLGSSDGFVVTGDSVSMMVEVVRLRLPLAIFPLSSRLFGRLDRRRRAATRWLFSLEGDRPADRLRRAAARALFRVRLAWHTRDFDAFHQMLIERGLAVWAGEPLEPPRGTVPDDAQRAAAGIRELLGPIEQEQGTLPAG